MATKHMTESEASVLERELPHGLTEEMRDVALCLYEALVISDERAGQKVPGATWLAQLTTWSHQVLGQMQHLINQKGGRSVYLAKSIAMQLSARDRELCAKFRGDNYYELAREHDLTEMRVRQIIDQWQRLRYQARQAVLPGLDSQ